MAAALCNFNRYYSQNYFRLDDSRILSAFHFSSKRATRTIAMIQLTIQQSKRNKCQSKRNSSLHVIPCRTNHISKAHREQHVELTWKDSLLAVGFQSSCPPIFRALAAFDQFDAITRSEAQIALGRSGVVV